MNVYRSSASQLRNYEKQIPITRIDHLFDQLQGA